MGGGEGVKIISAFSKLPNIHVFSDPVLVTLKIIIKKNQSFGLVLLCIRKIILKKEAEAISADLPFSLLQLQDIVIDPKPKDRVMLLSILSMGIEEHHVPI